MIVCEENRVSQQQAGVCPSCGSENVRATGYAAKKVLHSDPVTGSVEMSKKKHQPYTCDDCIHMWSVEV